MKAEQKTHSYNIYINELNCWQAPQFTYTWTHELNERKQLFSKDQHLVYHNIQREIYRHAFLFSPVQHLFVPTSCVHVLFFHSLSTILFLLRFSVYFNNGEDRKGWNERLNQNTGQERINRMWNVLFFTLFTKPYATNRYRKQTRRTHKKVEPTKKEWKKNYTHTEATGFFSFLLLFPIVIVIVMVCASRWYFVFYYYINNNTRKMLIIIIKCWMETLPVCQYENISVHSWNGER